jgi:peptidoglycan/LPS O-acetylase OafA/YrhL
MSGNTAYTTRPAANDAPQRASAGRGRMVGLDGLRAVAAGMVFAHHLGPTVFGRTAGTGLDVGVMVFFVLSGYVLYRPFATNGVAVGSYLVRRVARIWPAYLLAAFGVSVFLQQAFLAAPLDIVTMGHTPLGVVWTLKFELGFYCALPFIARLIRGLPSQGRLAVLVWLGSVSLALGSVLPAGSLSPLGTVAWAFVPGMIVAELSLTRPDLLRRTRILAAAGVALVAQSVITEAPFPDIAGGLGAALLLPLFAAWNPGRLTSVVAAAGGISYSVYLWHLPLIDAFGLWAIPLTLVISTASFVLVERPCIALARRLIDPWPAYPGWPVRGERLVEAAVGLRRGVAARMGGPIGELEPVLPTR